jgi:carnitine O-palmitoyltransferase 2
MEAALQHVVDSTPRAPAGAPPSLAVLTTADRDTWARAREELAAASPANRESLVCVDGALFHLSLDEVDLGTRGREPVAGAQVDAAARLALCGDARAAPRWFDQSLTHMVSADGVPMFSFEHSWGDGVPVVRCGAETWARIAKGEYGETAPADAQVTPPRRLEWQVPPSVAATRDAAAERYGASVAALELSVLRFGRWGASQLKAWGVSPDGIAQAALQLAFHRCAGRVGATYESCAMAHFNGGRTETIRPATKECAAFVLAVADGASPTEQAAALRASAKRHSSVAREAASGRGFDRHLFVLRRMAEERGSSPTLFSDPTYTHLSGNELSTSNPPAMPHSMASIFGPVHAEGYGVCYTTPSKELRFATTSYRPRSAAAFNEELKARRNQHATPT